MARNSIYLGVLAAVLTVPALAVKPALAQDKLIEEIITTGTRSGKERTASDSPVPIDVIAAFASQMLYATTPIVTP